MRQKRLAADCLALLLFAAAALWVERTGRPLLGAADLALVQLLHGSLGSVTHALFLPVRSARPIGAAIGVVVLLRIRSRRYAAAMAIALSFLLVVGTCRLGKRFTGLPRPYVVLSEVHDSLETRAASRESFPSSHAALAGVLAASLFGSRRATMGALAFLLYVMLSRVALAVHYPSDVLMGALYGIAATDVLRTIVDGGQQEGT